ncbi:MAG: hypothetical protein QM811_04290 [Pirellulales bacterium]
MRLSTFYRAPGVRGLMVCVSIVCVILAWIKFHIDRQESDRATLKTFAAANEIDLRYDVRTPPWPINWLKREDSRLVGMSCGNTLTAKQTLDPALLDTLARQTDLEELFVAFASGIEIDDAFYKHLPVGVLKKIELQGEPAPRIIDLLARAPAVEEVTFTKTDLDANALSALADQPNLKTVGFRYCKFDDGDLLVFKRMPALVEVKFFDTELDAVRVGELLTVLTKNGSAGFVTLNYRTLRALRGTPAEVNAAESLWQSSPNGSQSPYVPVVPSPPPPPSIGPAAGGGGGLF